MKALVLVALLAACRAPARAHDDGGSSGEPPTACTQLGATCTVSPGKLGTCVEVERTSGPSSFVCQSQH